MKTPLWRRIFDPAYMPEWWYYGSMLLAALVIAVILAVYW